MLADKISEGKITTRWIEKCLPQEYKRKHNKINNKNDKSEQMILGQIDIE